MIAHVVTFTWHQGTTEGQVAQLSEALDAFAPGVPGLLAYQHGPDLGLRAETADYAVVATLEGPDDLPGYLEHPEHVRIVRELLAPMLDSRQAVQIAIPAGVSATTGTGTR